MEHPYLQLRSALGFLSDRQFHVLSFELVHHSVFYGMFGLLALIKKYGLFERYNIQKGKTVDQALARKALRHVLTNHFISQPLFSWFVGYRLMHVRCPVDGPLPSLQTFIMHIIGCILLEDFCFYWLHRGLHHRLIYKHIHKQHHEFKVNTGICSQYAHPIEDVSNTVAFLFGPLLLGIHFSTFLVWTVIRISESVDAHSGYELPFLPWNQCLWLQGGAERHEYHHSHNIGCYGSYTKFWDWLCGTDKAYNKWKAVNAKANASKAK